MLKLPHFTEIMLVTFPYISLDKTKQSCKNSGSIWLKRKIDQISNDCVSL